MNIHGKVVMLRAIEESDLDRLHKWANDKDLQDQMGQIHFPSSLEFHKQWFRNQVGDSLNQRFAIHLEEVGIVGLSSIMQIDWRNRRAWHGVMLGEKQTRGRGIGLDAVMATMRYAFDEMQLERLDGSIIEYHQGSLEFYCKKLGWKEEGRRRRYYFRKGEYYDQIVVGITRADYEDLLKRTNYWGSK